MRAISPSRERNDVAARFDLAVSGASVTLRPTTGAEDLLLAEHWPPDPVLVLRLLDRLGRIEAGGRPIPDWTAMPVVDVDTLIVRLRQMLVGDRVIAEITCGAEACASRVDLSFSLEAYLAHNRSAARMPRGRQWSVESCADAPGWYTLRLRSAGVLRFRLPTLADQIAVYGTTAAEATLASRCIAAAGEADDCPKAVSSRARAIADVAMAAMATPLSGPLQGCCPECGTTITAFFDARLYCLQELHDRARFVYDDVDTLAERYHWSETAILALPHARRVNYAERARRAAVA
ncbi:MAG TPA: hypothetical protein VGX91_13585 [Candidatus Cybelea sp.]|nr:hypothetical protein [Candidatus Cybelea sp.]